MISENQSSSTLKANKSLSESEIIRRIENDYPAEYDPNSNLSAYDQLLICESLEESGYKVNNDSPSESVSVNENGNGTYKRRVNFELTPSKLTAITQLERCTYRTPPILVAQLLEVLFYEWESKPGHWLYIAQSWAPRAICRVIKQMVKSQEDGWLSMKNPSAYFTTVIKFRKRRKSNLAPKAA